MTKEEALEKMKLIKDRRDYDRELNHIDADDVLIELLRSLGYGEICDEWEKIDKWYA